MDKRHQVFVSSTYKDLIDERQEVMQALLETDCIPAGMELFPASSDSQWEYIKRVIDECDYYILILAGRYGSLSPEGMSYTEKEYRYALEKDKPVIAFLHKEPGSIISDKTESDANGKKKLLEFRNFIQDKLCRFFLTPQELGAVVSRSITQLKKSHPTVGWVRADSVISGDSAEEILKLKKDIENLEKELLEANKIASVNIEIDKSIEFEVSIDFISGYIEESYIADSKLVKQSFNFSKILDDFIIYFTEPLFKREIRDFINDYVKRDQSILEIMISSKYEDVTCDITENSVRKFISVLLALDIIVLKLNQYWLSTFGEKLLSLKVRDVYLKGETNA